jgi:hypothetical protein
MTMELPVRAGVSTAGRSLAPTHMVAVLTATPH